ncbi:MAG: hypothetical protein JNK23_01925 [Opitutaceae bacterium]|nr:hypothetical protein [Opitutaceae bacterium]
MPTSRLIDTPVLQVSDPDLVALISELSEVTTVVPEASQTLFGFLVQCVYPAGAGHRYKLEKDRLTFGLFLLRKVGSLQTSAIYSVCDELAKMKNQSAEVALTTALYVFLNRYLPDFEKRPKKTRYDPRGRRA